MNTGSMYLWRFKDKGGTFSFGYVIQRSGSMVQLGAYNGAISGVWVKESEIEYEEYRA